MRHQLWAAAGLLVLASSASPVPIIVDTDLGTNCGDVGALAVLHALADLGEARILATMSSSKNPDTAPCLDAINPWYGRPGLPIGGPQGAGALRPSKYAAELARRYPHRLDSADQAADAASLYREVLLRGPAHSGVIGTG